MSSEPFKADREDWEEVEAVSRSSSGLGEEQRCIIELRDRVAALEKKARTAEECNDAICRRLDEIRRKEPAATEESSPDRVLARSQTGEYLRAGTPVYLAAPAKAVPSDEELWKIWYDTQEEGTIEHFRALFDHGYQQGLAAGRAEQQAAPEESSAAQSDPAMTALELPRDWYPDFADWLERQMPEGTVIGDPLWWASCIADWLIAKATLGPEPNLHDIALGMVDSLGRSFHVLPEILDTLRRAIREPMAEQQAAAEATPEPEPEPSPSPPAATRKAEHDDGDDAIDRWVDGKSDWIANWGAPRSDIAALIGEALEHWGRSATREAGPQAGAEISDEELEAIAKKAEVINMKNQCGLTASSILGIYNQLHNQRIAGLRAVWDRAVLARWGGAAVPPKAPPTEEDIESLAEALNGDPVPAIRRALELWGGAAVSATVDRAIPAAVLEERFERWWYDEGSVPPSEGRDWEEHVHHMTRIAWHNGAFVAAGPAADSTDQTTITNNESC